MTITIDTPRPHSMKEKQTEKTVWPLRKSYFPGPKSHVGQEENGQGRNLQRAGPEQLRMMAKNISPTEQHQDQFENFPTARVGVIPVLAIRILLLLCVSCSSLSEGAFERFGHSAPLMSPLYKG